MLRMELSSQNMPHSHTLAFPRYYNRRTKCSRMFDEWIDSEESWSRQYNCPIYEVFDDMWRAAIMEWGFL